MTTSNQLITALSSHIGKGNGISAKALAHKLGIDTRQLRKLISQAVFADSVAICGTPRDGYFIAASGDELIETIEWHDHRAKHELKKSSCMRKLLGDLFGQQHLPT